MWRSFTPPSVRSSRLSSPVRSSLSQSPATKDSPKPISPARSSRRKIAGRGPPVSLGARSRAPKTRLCHREARAAAVRAMRPSMPGTARPTRSTDPAGAVRTVIGFSGGGRRKTGRRRWKYRLAACHRMRGHGESGRQGLAQHGARQGGTVEGLQPPLQARPKTFRSPCGTGSPRPGTAARRRPGTRSCRSAGRTARRGTPWAQQTAPRGAPGPARGSRST